MLRRNIFSCFLSVGLCLLILTGCANLKLKHAEIRPQPAVVATAPPPKTKQAKTILTPKSEKNTSAEEQARQRLAKERAAKESATTLGANQILHSERPAEVASPEVAPQSIGKSTAPKDNLSKEINSYYKKLLLEYLRFTPPNIMKMGDTIAIYATLPQSKIEHELSNHFSRHPSEYRSIIKGYNYIQAHLAGGPNFKIKPIIPEDQAVLSDKSEWGWNVTPEVGGEIYLYLTLSTLNFVNTITIPRVVHTFSNKIKIHVSTMQHFKNDLDYTYKYSTILASLGIGSLFGAFFRKIISVFPMGNKNKSAQNDDERA